MGFPIVRTGTVAFIVSGRPQRRSAVSTLVKANFESDALRGGKTSPGAGPGCPHGRDVAAGTRVGTTAPRGCPRLPLPKGAGSCESPRWPRGTYAQGHRELEGGVADLGRRYQCDQTIKLKRGEERGHRVTTRAARSTAVSFQTRAGGAPPRPGRPATALCRCRRRRASGVFGLLGPGTLARRLRSVRSDFISSKSTNLKKRARFVVL